MAAFSRSGLVKFHYGTFLCALFVCVISRPAKCQNLTNNLTLASDATTAAQLLNLVTNAPQNGSSFPTQAPSGSSAIVSAGLTLPDSTGVKQSFTAMIPIHLLPSNKIVDYFPWEVEIGLATCPYTGMLVTAHRGVFGAETANDEKLDDLINFPSPHCSVECECMATGDYRCKSVCPPPPNDMDYCVPVSVPGQCCHKYVCDDELDTAFPTLQFPEPVSSTSSNPTLLMCMPGSVLPDSVCHRFFPRAFSGHLGPKGVCFGYDDIRCAWLDDNEVATGAETSAKAGDDVAETAQQQGRLGGSQTLFFQTALNGTVFSTDVPLKKLRNKSRSPRRL